MQEVRRAQLRNMLGAGVPGEEGSAFGFRPQERQEGLWGGRERPGSVCDTRSAGRTSMALTLDKESLLPNQEGVWKREEGWPCGEQPVWPRKALELWWGHCKAWQTSFLGEGEGGRQTVGD